MILCKICLALKGLNGDDLYSGKCDFVFLTQEGLNKHLKKVHNIEVKDEKQ